MEILEITAEVKNTDPPIFNFKQRCYELKATLIRNYPILNMDDLYCGDGDKVSMMDRLQRKLGLSQDELYQIIVNLQ